MEDPSPDLLPVHTASTSAEDGAVRRLRSCVGQVAIVSPSHHQTQTKRRDMKRCMLELRGAEPKMQHTRQRSGSRTAD